MKSLRAWVVTAIAVTASLVACSGTGTIVPNASQPMPASRATSSPCNFQEVWALHGSCIKFAMHTKARTTVTLQAYQGIVLTSLWPPAMPPEPNSFIAGDATGNGDITGTLKGSRFPKYGSVKCVDFSGYLTTCPGKAFLYSFIANATSFGIGFNHLPSTKITNTGPYPGTKCLVAYLAETSTRKWVWQLLDMPWATPVAGTLTLKASSLGLILNSGVIVYFSYICK